MEVYKEDCLIQESVNDGSVWNETERTDMYNIEELIELAASKGASDVHLIAGLPPKCRIDGRIMTLTEEP